MPPLAIYEMSERLQDGYDIENQVNSTTVKNNDIPALVLTEPTENKVPASVKAPCNFLPLPSSPYRYTKWHDIQCMEVKGNMLRSPRIRRAPKGYNAATIQAIGDAGNNEQKHRSVRDRWKERKRLHYQSKLEAWETCEAVNLSYQELGDPYQVEQFLSVLQKLIRCESLQLIDNRLEDLSTVFLPRCRHLHLQRNFLSNLKKLPRSPKLTHLSLQQNNIKSLAGLAKLRKTDLISLTLKDNPVELDPHYRQNVFKLLPNLQILDDIAKTREDSTENLSDTCVIS